MNTEFNHMIGLKAITTIRPEIGTIQKIEGEYVLIDYPCLGFSEMVNYKMIHIKIID